MIKDDLYQDQIMLNHESRYWTQKFSNDIESWLTDRGYNKSIASHSIFQVYDKSNHVSVTVNLLHDNRDIDSNHVLISDMIIHDHHGPQIHLWPEIFGVYHQRMIYDHKIPSKKFNCFINRACEFRQSWLYQLIRTNQLEQGHVSYHAHDRFSNDKPSIVFEKLFKKNNKIFQHEHDYIKDRIPLKTFDLPLEDAIVDSERSLVIETFFDDPKFISYSEKIWRVIQLPRPWILFASVKAIHYLRTWGFDVFDDVIDHSYDLEPDPIRRQLMCLKQLDRPLHYDQQTLINYEKRAEYNRDLLLQYRKLWHDKYRLVLTLLEALTSRR